jgi:transcriptional regulator with XRE-family HTH domain
MHESTAWRELLGSLIEHPAERERIVTQMGINSVTLSRWANGLSNPRPQKLHALLKAIPPEYQTQFQELLTEAGLLSLAPSTEESQSKEVPYTLIHEVLETRAHSWDQLRFWAISSQVLQHALRHLDVKSVGISLSIVRCMPPREDGRIHSLHERLGVGTAPWVSSLQPKALFLGADSLAGYATMRGHFEQVADLRGQTTFVPAHCSAHEVSTAACPIMYSNRIAGCLLLSSTQPHYFLAEVQQVLIREYTNVLALAFESDEFYPLECLDLAMMPSWEVQEPHLAGFRQRVVNLLREAENAGHPLTVPQAEERAWQHIEELLLHLPV